MHLCLSWSWFFFLVPSAPPQWRHQSQSEAAPRPGCPSVCWPAEPRALGTIIQRFRPLKHFSSDFKISPPSLDHRVPADHFLPFISHHKKMILFILSSLLVKWNWLAEDNTLFTATGFSHPFLLLLVALVISIQLDIYLDIIYSTSASAICPIWFDFCLHLAFNSIQRMSPCSEV